jgi:CRISPR/Cas system Type II protein with McrA/HNH and RuvC-like nuclease domain
MNFIELEENEQGIDATTLKIKNDETKNILNNIMSPSVKKAVGYSFKLINAYLHKVKKEYDVESICIELTRSNNSKEERENITEMQKKNKEDRDVLNDSLSEEEVKRIEGISNSNFTKALL